MKQKLLFSLLLILTSLISKSQLLINYRYKQDQLVKEKFIKKNSGIKIISSDYQGSPYSMAYFTNSTPCFNCKKGIVLSTGYAYSIAHPNFTGNTSTSLGVKGNRLLSRIVHNRTFDAAILHIVFIPYTDTINFKYFFGSEEYPEYVNKGVNDIFGFFIRKKGDITYKNIALLPDKTPVTVNNINARTNSKYYIPNHIFGKVRRFPMNFNNKEIILSQEFTFDGFTTELTAGAKVVPYKEYELLIAIADVGDDLYDSGVFLEAESFHAENYYPTIVNKIEKKLQKTIEESNNKLSLRLTKDSLIIESHIEFETNKYTIVNEYKTLLDTLSKTLSKIKNLNIYINGYTDNIGSESYNINLSQKRSQSIADYLIQHNIPNHIITCKGFGSNYPLATNNTKNGRAKNRRVEFIITKKK